jgi:hypothetical protein
MFVPRDEVGTSHRYRDLPRKQGIETIASREEN